MELTGLGYLGIGVADLDAWAAFLDTAGATVTISDQTLVAATVDGWERRLIVGAGSDDVSFVGWEVADAAALDRLAARLSGWAPVALSIEELDVRRASGAFAVTDPIGVRLEFFHGPKVAVRADVGTGPFVTGSLGLGHVVLATDDLERARAFYLDLLGFQHTDTCVLDGVEIVFLRCNARHHSLALAALPSHRRRLLHFMLEADHVDTVGAASDRFRNAGLLRTTLGRHSNDHMLSFYATTPSGFAMEFGYDGDLITSGRHVPSTFFSESAWGHHQLIATEDL